MIDFKKIKIYSDTPEAARAAELFSEEMRIRTNDVPDKVTEKESSNFRFLTKTDIHKDGFDITVDDTAVTVCASGIRGFIYGFGMLLRKLVSVCGVPSLAEDVSGKYRADKRIRGHQVGYRTTPNTYDAWTYEDYRRYYLDMMFFGTNTVEHIPYEKGVSRRNRLMKYDEEEFLVRAPEMADEFDLDVS